MEYNKDIGLMLRARRESLGLSQRKLSQKCGLSDVWISSVERATISPKRGSFYELCSALKIPRDIAKLLYNVRIEPGARLLEDGSLQEANGLVRRASGGLGLPDGGRLVGRDLVWPQKGPRGLRLREGDQPPPSHLLGPAGELPPGMWIDPYGHLRFADEREGSGLTDEEHAVLGVWRSLSKEKREAAGMMLRALQICEFHNREEVTRGEEPTEWGIKAHRLPLPAQGIDDIEFYRRMAVPADSTDDD